MKKLVIVCIIGLILFPGLGAVALPAPQSVDVNTRSELIVVSEPVLEDAGRYVSVSLAEAASFLLNPGKPLLPVVTKVFSFPFGTTIRDVSVSVSETNQVWLSKPVIPAVALTPRDAVVVNEPVEDPITYESNVVYPASPYRVTLGAGLQGTDHVVFVIVQWYPVRYSPALDILYFSDQAEIHLTTEAPAAPILFSDAYDLVIIAPARFSSNLEPLIEHKIRMGVRTVLKTTDEIYAQYNGFDDAEKIKYFIQDALETWGVAYVLLVGDVGKVPIRTTWLFQRHHEHYWNETVLTDLYYADIYDSGGGFSSWDTNGNGLYGELYDDCPGVSDICDYYPDVHVGRLPCTKATEVKTVGAKIIRYETGAAGESWFDTIILVGGDTFPGWNGNEGEIKNLLTEDIMSDFTPIKLWTSDGTFTARSLNQAINRGAGFIDYSGHGFEIGVGTHPPDDEEWIYYQTPNLLGALNGEMLPIVFFDACLTAKLDFNFSELVGYASEGAADFVGKFSFIASRLIPTFAWCMVKKKTGGAIATIGATRTAFGGIDSGAGCLSLRFFEGYATSETVAEMMTHAQNEYLATVPSDRFTVQEFILIGDPSLRIGGYE